MLLDFSVENFASIGARQTISLITGKARGKSEHLLNAHRQRVLKFSSIYGGNGAGKSTLIKAMHFGKKMILHGYLDKRQMATNKSSQLWMDAPTEFTYTLFLNGKLYEYGFKLFWKEEKVVKEWLIEKNSRLEPHLVFIRDFAAHEFELNIRAKDPEVANRLSVYFNDASSEDNILFLNEINSHKGNLFTADSSFQYLRTIYRWFLSKLKFVYPNGSDLGRYSFINYPENHGDLHSYLSSLDIPISEMSYVEIPFEQAFGDVPETVVKDIENDFKELCMLDDRKDASSFEVVFRLLDSYYIVVASADGISSVKTISFTHGKYGTYEFKEESDGTKRILELLEMITSPENDITYVVDEIDRSLHPLLTEELISMYLSPERPNQNQLIITTHESRLLNLKRLRKDEIYFASNKNEQSEFVRLDKYDADTRTDLNIELSYLNGRYGGIPKIIKRGDT